MSFLYSIRALFLLTFGLTNVTALSSSLKQVRANIGFNPTTVKLHIYVPNSVALNPAIILALHDCGSSGPLYFNETTYSILADTHAFIVLYPSAPDRGTKCWDVHSIATLTHNAGGDSLGLANFVRYAISTYNGTVSKVFVTGTSSGAMMTNVLAGAYPDLFTAGSAFSGVPYGCFKGPLTWNCECADGKLIKRPEAWGDLVRAGYPGYNGTRPRLQLWHGTTDAILYYQNLVEANKQWSNVFGISWMKNKTNTPQSGYTQMVFGNGTQLVAYSAEGVGHSVPVHESAVLDWFGITGDFPNYVYGP